MGLIFTVLVECHRSDPHIYLPASTAGPPSYLCGPLESRNGQAFHAVR